MSTDRDSQYAALARLDAFGTTGLYDSVARAIALTQERQRAARALVLLSDGNDRYSTTTAEAALDEARRSDVMVYPIALGTASPPFFERLAALTGGRVFPSSDPRLLNDTMRRVARELRLQYLLGYAPARPGSGTRRVARDYRPRQAARAVASGHAMGTWRARRVLRVNLLVRTVRWFDRCAFSGFYGERRFWFWWFEFDERVCIDRVRQARINEPAEP